MKNEAFRSWLSEAYSARGGRLTRKAVSDVLARSKRVETLLGDNLDNLLKAHSIDHLKAALAKALAKSRGYRSATYDLTAAISRYEEFRKAASKSRSIA
jgi:hypothetical protein